MITNENLYFHIIKSKTKWHKLQLCSQAILIQYNSRQIYLEVIFEKCGQSIRKVPEYLEVPHKFSSPCELPEKYYWAVNREDDKIMRSVCIMV